MKKIFLTGATGFIGSHLLEKLVVNGYKVKILAEYNIDNSLGWIDSFKKEIRENVEVVYGNIRDPFIISNNTKNYDVLIHLAALISIPYSYKSPSEFIETNIQGTLNALEAAKKNNLNRFIGTSTSEVYGTAQFTPINENHPINAQSPYAATKVAADQLCVSYFKTYNMPITIIRPFNTFGPRQSLRAVLPNIFLSSNKKEKKIILKIGSTETKRDFCYITDTVDGFLACLNTNKKINGETINLGSGKSYSISQMIKIVEKVSNKRFLIHKDPLRIRPKKSEVQLLEADISKAKKLIGWEPKVNDIKSLESSIQETLKWFKKKNNINFYNLKRYNI